MREGNVDDLMIYPRSRVEEAGNTYFLARMQGEKVLVVDGDAAGFEGSPMGDRLACPLSPGNAAIAGRLGPRSPTCSNRSAP